jgi:hypothetical protein
LGPFLFLLNRQLSIHDKLRIVLRSYLVSLANVSKPYCLFWIFGSLDSILMCYIPQQDDKFQALDVEKAPILF